MKTFLFIRRLASGFRCKQVLIGNFLLLLPASLMTQPLEHCPDSQFAIPASSTVPAHACGNGLCVRVSHEGGLWASRDGHLWAEQPLAARPFFRSVTFGDGLFVAVGGSYIDLPGVIMTSHDGTNWVRRHSRNKINLHSVAHGHGLFVAVGDQGTIFTSQDGACWKKRRWEASVTLAAIAFGNGVFVAGGESGTILTSTNGVQWTGQTLGHSLYVGKVVFRDDHFLFQNAEVAFTSMDGRGWIRRDDLQGISQLLLPGQLDLFGKSSRQGSPFAD